jgi:hypothetical protein
MWVKGACCQQWVPRLSAMAENGIIVNPIRLQYKKGNLIFFICRVMVFEKGFGINPKA